jgi:hypothetical protein
MTPMGAIDFLGSVVEGTFPCPVVLALIGNLRSLRSDGEGVVASLYLLGASFFGVGYRLGTCGWRLVRVVAKLAR